ncbi:Plug domain-containing protein, partial [Glaesserella parasuis]|nr:Plug domain-containing protein [Glaesserella parasuis]
MIKNKTTAFSLLLCCLGINAEQLELDEISVMGKVPEGNSISFLKVSDAIIDGEKFKNRSATLGNALSSELGVHSTPFGGGASAPIIRGQEGVRVKILQNNADVVDMSNISPDHAITADTLLANQVEILRGASTLLYASSSPAGIVNIVDQRIPNKMPKKGY